MNNLDEIICRLNKLEFHVKLLAESLNHSENPIASLVVDFNWSEQDLDKAHDIFEIFDKKITNSEEVNWSDFENEFNQKLNISYQGLKSVVLSLFRNGQWSEVCHAYAASFGDSIPLELISIVGSKSRSTDSSKRKLLRSEFTLS